MNHDRLKEMLVQHEGTGPVKNGRLFPYRCSAGKLTIGIGRNIEERGISEAEAEFMLENDINDSVNDCKRMFLNFDLLDDVRQEVLINMMLNMGYNTFSQFKRFIAAIKAGNFNEAAKQMEDSAWYRQVGQKPGQRAYELRMMMLTGKV